MVDALRSHAASGVDRPARCGFIELRLARSCYEESRSIPGRVGPGGDDREGETRRSRFARRKSAGGHRKHAATRRSNDQRTILQANRNESLARRDRATISACIRRAQVTHFYGLEIVNPLTVTSVLCPKR